MWDPKKLTEDRTPAPPRPAPRGTSIDDTRMALRAGHCVQCGTAYGFGATVGYNLGAPGSAFSPESDGYCLTCWRAIHDTAAR